MKDIGAPLTARIICEQLGFDFAEIGTEKIARWTTALLAQIGRMQTREEMLQNAREMCELQNYLIPHIRARESAPRARSEERRVGKEWVSTCRNRGARSYIQQKEH